MSNPVRYLCIIILSFAFVRFSLAQEIKIPLSPTNIIEYPGFGNPEKLVNEQEVAGDPLNSPGGTPSSTWETGFMSYVPYPVFTTIDLGRPYQLSHVFLRDVNGMGNFIIETGVPGNWTELFSDPLTGYQSWNQHDVNVVCRYLHIGRETPTSNCSELVLYGYDIFASSYDTIPPAAITDLDVETVSSSVVELSWTAPGDDDFSGNVNFYDLRYNTEPITSANFLQSTSVPLNASLVSGGIKQLFLTANLPSGYPLYFAFYAYDDILNRSELSNNAYCVTPVQLNGPSQQIYLQAEMLINESAWGNASLLIDEQASVGDVIGGSGAAMTTAWVPGNLSWQYPASLIIDLKANYQIDHVAYFDGNNSTGAGSIRIETGTPFHWDELATDTLTHQGIWRTLSTSDTCRYLRITLMNQNAIIQEITIFGSALNYPEPVPSEITAEKPLMKDFIGANAFVNIPRGRLNAVGALREYHNWRWVEGNNSSSYPGYPNNQNDFSPSSLGWDFDQFYRNCKTDNMFCFPDIKENVLWLCNNNWSAMDYKPVSPGDDPLLPQSYIEHADHLYQYAARYGSVQVDAGNLKLASGQPAQSGSGDLSYYENWNEPDKWWKGRDGFFQPYEYAAMSSADYDGHLGSMGATIGLQNADPSAKLVMAGLAETDLNYVKALKLWCDEYRNGDFIWSVLNFHHYCRKWDNALNSYIGISPEEAGLKEVFEEVVSWKNKYLPETEVWVSEFGYDTHSQSPQRAPQIGSFSAEEVQAQWLVRSYLELAAAGVDKAFMYMLKNANDWSSEKYATSGLVHSDQSQWQPKVSWYYIYTLKNRLGDYSFQREMNPESTQIKIYKFSTENQHTAAYVVWCPTSNQSVIAQYELQLDSTKTNAKLVTFESGSVSGVDSILSVQNSKVTLTVSERPVIVLVSDTADFFESYALETRLVLDSAMMHAESGHNGCFSLIDEQGISGDVINGLGGSPQTCWQVWGSQNYDTLYAYLDLGQIYDISRLYIRDTNGYGNYAFSVGEPGNWEEISSDQLKNYQKWNEHGINRQSRYLRITRFPGGGNLSELVLYVRD